MPSNPNSMMQMMGLRRFASSNPEILEALLEEQRFKEKLARIKQKGAKRKEQATQLQAPTQAGGNTGDNQYSRFF